MAALVAFVFVTLRPLENNALPLWDRGFAGAATLASVGWGLKDPGLYCVAVMLVALVVARTLASDSQRVCAARRPATMT